MNCSEWTGLSPSPLRVFGGEANGERYGAGLCLWGLGTRMLCTGNGSRSSSDEVFRRIADGDLLSMRTLFARHRVPIYRWLLRIVGDAAKAEDLLRDVFLDVWRNAASFEGRSSVSTWLLTIAGKRRCLHEEIVGQNVAGATQGARRIRLAMTGALWRRANVRNGAAVRLSKLGHAAREIAQMQAQLIERKAECKDALHCLLRQRSREAFAA